MTKTIVREQTVPIIDYHYVVIDNHPIEITDPSKLLITFDKKQRAYPVMFIDNDYNILDIANLFPVKIT